MANGFAIVIGAVILGSGIAISGGTKDIVDHYLNQQLESACWDPEVTSGLNGLVAEEAKPSIENSYPSGMSQSDQDAVTKSLSVKLSDYAFTISAQKGGTIYCEAAVSFTYIRPNKSVYTNTEGKIISYRVYPAQGGYTPVMNSADIPDGVIVYHDGSSTDGTSSN